MFLPWIFMFEGHSTFQQSSQTYICHEMLEIVIEEVLWSIQGFIEQYQVLLSRIVKGILDLDHLQ